MKSLFKKSCILTLAAFMALSILSCSNDSGDDADAGSNTVAKFIYERGNNGSAVNTLIFYKDGTFEFIEEKIWSANYTEKDTSAKGTYKLDSGDWENGSVTLTATSGKKASTSSGTVTIKDKKLTFGSYTYTATFTSKVESDTSKDSSSSNSSDSTKNTESSSSNSSDSTKNTDSSSSNSSDSTKNTDSSSNNSSNSDKDTETSSGSKKLIATYSGYPTVYGINWPILIIVKFYSDGTYTQDGVHDSKGTYTFESGDFDNGNLTLHETHERNDAGNMVEKPSTISCTIKNGVLTNEYGSFSKESSSGSSSKNTDSSSSSTDTSAEVFPDESYPAIKIIAVFYGGTEDNTKIIYFYSDKTYNLHLGSYDSANGTYEITSGNFNNGKITLNQTNIRKSYIEKETKETIICTSTDGDLKYGNTNTSLSRMDSASTEERDKYVACYNFWALRGSGWGSEENIYFYKDGTFELYETDFTKLTILEKTNRELKYKGTYTLKSGDWENGEVNLKVTESDDRWYIGEDRYKIKNKKYNNNYCALYTLKPIKINADEKGISWSDYPGAIKYKVYMCDIYAGGNFNMYYVTDEPKEVSGNSYEISNESTTYDKFILIKAVCNGYESGYSNVIRIPAKTSKRN
ncbi:MAG: hypothetical protein K5873_01600 [Treponema sp.]|nr:hypothetical protein [Treponema sp.]